MDWSAFFTIHQDLPREGPGESADVHWALKTAGVFGTVRVLDAACGPGADLVTLAEDLPSATITGIEKHTGFVAQAHSRVASFGPRVQVIEGEMADPGGPYDFIWCAGALYFLGVTEGLSLWKDALSPGGKIAFSEPVLLDGPQPAEVSEFWEEYPSITKMDGIHNRIKAAGYRVTDTRMIVGAPWEAYYAPMVARIAKLRAEDPSPALTEALDLSAREAELWAAVPDHIAYALFVVQPE